MTKLYVNDHIPVLAQALTDAVARLLVRTEVTPLIKLGTIKDAVANEDPQFLLVNADSYIHSSQVTVLKHVMQRLDNTQVILMTEHPRKFLLNLLRLKDGDQVISSRVSWMEFSKAIRETIEPQTASAAEEPQEVIKLTKRQKQILILSQQGKSNRELAEILNLSEHTIKVHAWRLYQRLNVNSRLGALAKARQMGVL